jgi:hypothetical protein
MDPELVRSLIRWASVGLFSVLVPIGIYVGRANIRVSRREIVRDLERLFQFAKAKADGRPLILPSFELVKYKYDPDSNPDRPVTSWTRTHSASMHSGRNVCHFDAAMLPFRVQRR